MRQAENRWKGSLQTIIRQKARAHNRRIPKNLDVVPNQNAKTAFTERFFIPLEERGVVKRFLATLDNNKRR